MGCVREISHVETTKENLMAKTESEESERKTGQKEERK